MNQVVDSFFHRLGCEGWFSCQQREHYRSKAVQVTTSGGRLAFGLFWAHEVHGAEYIRAGVLRGTVAFGDAKIRDLHDASQIAFRIFSIILRAIGHQQVARL